MEFYKRKKRANKRQDKLNKFGKYNRRHVRIIILQLENGKKNKKKIYPSGQRSDRRRS